MSGPPVTVWAQTHDFTSSSPLSDLYACEGQFEARRQNTKLNRDRLQMNQKIGSCSFHKNEPQKTEGWLLSHKTVTMICL